MCKVTIGLLDHDIENVKSILRKSFLQPFDDHISLEEFKNKTKVMLNGAWIGFTDNPQAMVDSVKYFRTSGKISHEVSVVRDIVQKEIKLYTDSGRCMRPLFKVR